MWHLSFAAANLVLSVATAVAFSSKLSRGWVKLKRSSAGTSADKEVRGQVPQCNQRKPLISSNSWERGILFVRAKGDTQGDVSPCSTWMDALSGCSSAALCAPVSFFRVLLFCLLHFVHLGQQTSSVSAFPMAEGEYLSKRGENLVSGSAADGIWSFSMWSSTPKSNLVDFKSRLMKSTGLL